MFLSTLLYNITPKFFFIGQYLNRIIIINMCVQFIIVVLYDKLITNKVL